MDIDLFFISFQETNSDKNWLELKRKFPMAQRVHGVRGIAQAHREAADKSKSHFFFVIDADNRVRSDFDFRLPEEDLRDDTLYVWRCFNPANNLVYGFGAIKLYNKSLIERRHNGYLDLATTVAERYKIIHQVASDTYFFSTPEEAWRGAFRECAKLASGLIHRQNSKETQERLNIWCTVENSVPNSHWIIRGAEQGREFGKNNHQEISKINDYRWLKQRFDEQQN